MKSPTTMRCGAFARVCTALAPLALLAGTAHAQVPPLLTIQDASIAEGNSGTLTLQLNMSLSSPASQPVGAQFTATPLSGAAFNAATAGAGCTAGVDYRQTVPPIPVAIAVGGSSASVSITICGDTSAEPNEHIFINLGSVSGAQCLEGTCNGIVTIQDDDGPPQVSVSDAGAREPLNGTKKIAFTVSLSRPTKSSVSVAYATRDGTARSAPPAGTAMATCPLVDYFPRSGTVTVAPGATTAATPIEVTICADRIAEPAETFRVDLSAPVNATPGDMSATGTITDSPLPTSINPPGT